MGIRFSRVGTLRIAGAVSLRHGKASDLVINSLTEVVEIGVGLRATPRSINYQQRRFLEFVCLPTGLLLVLLTFLPLRSLKQDLLQAIYRLCVWT